jgi:TRAP-type mannitol/chloroaromatic compound transport system substrate-binding protein
MINKTAYEKLPEDLKEIVKVCAADINKQMFNEWILKDAEYYQKMLKEGTVQFREFPLEVVKQMKIYAKEVVDDLAGKNEMTKKIYESFSKFQSLYEPYQEISERAFVKALKS